MLISGKKISSFYLSEEKVGRVHCTFKFLQSPLSVFDEALYESGTVQQEQLACV
jgi:hypothetical protein